MPAGSHERCSIAPASLDTAKAVLRAVVPGSARRLVRERVADRRRDRAWPVLAAAVAELRAVAPADPPPALLDELRRGWGDPDSAPTGLMLAAIETFRPRTSDGVECGSGLSTIVMGVYAEALGRRWWALDQELGWAARVRSAASRLGLHAATVLDAPLRAYGDFEWYTIGTELPRSIDFVLCDGPPANLDGIRRRRYGLVPVLGDRFTEDVAILLDDAVRPGEQEVLELWRRAGFEWRGGEASRRFAVVTRAAAS
jgi:hypothetical protein